MLKLKDGRVEFRGAVEVDELYVNAGLKGRNNSIRIKHLGRGGGEDYVPSSKVEAEAAIKIVSRRIRKDSTIYTDNFKSYIGLSGLGYMHEYVNHSEGECHINNCENKARFLDMLSIHRGICKDNLKLYLAAFKTCRRSRNANPIQAIIEIIKTIYIITATTFLVKSEKFILYILY